MDVDKIRELIELMKQNELSEIKIIDGETRLLLRRGGVVAPVVMAPVAAPVPPAIPAPGAASPAAPAGETKDSGLVPIASPMVGTFYAAPAPDADPYVRVGQRVHADMVVCIIEAMKVMNEIKAEVTGVIEQVLVENGKPVEFGQPLFMVRPG
jgi:acetyl-CoA carboxylase biotin carboxyl carrier protein